MIRSILGPNAYMARQRLNELLADVDPNSIERFEGESLDLNKLRNSVQAQSLFTNPTVVVSNISEQKSLHEDLMKLIESLSDSAELIIYEPAIDKRSSYYKFLLKNTQAEEYKALDAQLLAKWLASEAKARGGEMNWQSANYLIERAGEDQWLLSNELDKLLLSDQEVSKSLIDEMVEPTPKESIFKLLDSITAKNQNKVIELYDNLIAQRLEPQYILSMLIWQLHILAIMVYAGERTVDDVAKEAKISPFVAKKTAQVAKKTSKTQVRSMLESTAKLDADLKSKPIDGAEALKQLLIKISN